MEHKFVFICGLHRSGTSPLFKALREHPKISGFHDTGVPEDEGQHLQTVLPPDGYYGGPGAFGFNKEAHLTEESEFLTDANKQRLLESWSQHWDMRKPVLLEKSPPDLTRTRFLQAAFPNSYFIVVVRHPVAVALATSKWGNANLASQIRHWVHCHRLFREDRPHLKHVKIVRFGQLIRDPKPVIGDVHEFLGLERCDFSMTFKPDANAAYFERWLAMQNGKDESRCIESLVARFEPAVRNFGFSLKDTKFLGPAFGILT